MARESEFAVDDYRRTFYRLLIFACTVAHKFSVDDYRYIVYNGSMVTNKSSNGYAQFDNIHKKFKCPKCQARGLTLTERPEQFKCTHCGLTRPLNFWHKTFRKAPATMTFKQASALIGANPTGSTLRRANLEGRLKTTGRQGKKDYLIAKDDLIHFYLTQFGHRPKKREAVLE